MIKLNLARTASNAIGRDNDCFACFQLYNVLKVIR